MVSNAPLVFKKAGLSALFMRRSMYAFGKRLAATVDKVHKLRFGVVRRSKATQWALFIYI